MTYSWSDMLNKYKLLYLAVFDSIETRTHSVNKQIQE